MAPLVLLLALAAAGLPALMVPSVLGQPSGRGPILIDGDDDFCDDDEEGVVNCATADGSAERPYVIEGWTIVVANPPPCASVPLASCAAPPACDGSIFAAAVSVCRTRAHVVVRDLRLDVQSADPNVAVIALLGSSHVTVEDIAFTARGTGIAVAPWTDREERRFPADDIVLQRVQVEAAVPSLPFFGESPSGAFLPTLLHMRDANVTVRGSLFDAGARPTALHMDARQAFASGVTHDFRVETSRIWNATLHGVRVEDARVTLLGNAFAGSGVAPRVFVTRQGGHSELGLPSAALLLASREYEIHGNAFDLGQSLGLGINVETNATGHITGNQFRQEQGARAHALHVSPGFGCRARFAFNGVETLLVSNSELDCFLDARSNWWGRPEGPEQGGQEGLRQANGRVVHDPWLRFPLDKLPRVTVEPVPSPVHGTLILRGAAVTVAENPLRAIELSRSRDDWSQVVVAEGTASWSLAWDLTQERLGRLTAWVRACGESECGLPTVVEVEHVETPLPPVAILEARPRLARIGESVSLDASSSYSPQGRGLVAYRFAAGAGALEWQESPRLDVAFDERGAHTASVEVRDAAGLVSTNVASVVVRVTGAPLGTESGPTGSIPGFELAGLIAAAAGALLLAGARRRSA